MDAETNYIFSKVVKEQNSNFNVPIQEHTYPLPDPDISSLDRNAYGYFNDEMLPLSRKRAVELFEKDLTVYLLYEDNTEAMAFDREDITNHGGIFGIERTDWIAFKDYEVMKEAEKFSISELEQRFLDSPADSFAIYQLKNDEELRNYRFEGLERLQKAGLSVEHDNYEMVYTAPLTDFNVSQSQTLNRLYEQFNINHPADFRGHSLSISDVVALKVNGKLSFHYVDSYGFAEQANFLPQKNYLETAEKSTEQNYNQIDGIINNQPEKLEQTVKEGRQLSGLELAPITREEKNDKRSSVVEQLKTKVSVNKEKQKTASNMGAEMER